jgi:hypothetical protein
MQEALLWLAFPTTAVCRPEAQAKVFGEPVCVESSPQEAEGRLAGNHNHLDRQP